MGETDEGSILLQQFEAPFNDGSGEKYTVYVYGRTRPGDNWKGWLVFERHSDGTRLSTGVETTQPNAEAVTYWATGLSTAYFEGALNRAQSPPSKPRSATVVAAPPHRTLSEIERAVVACFSRRHRTRLQTRSIMDDLPDAHADVVRALEDLEKQGGLLVRQTEEGTDWVLLTENGVEAAGVGDVPRTGTIERQAPSRRH
ncbi:MAG TPA: hypothetical protein VF701_01130 [Thermoanaerobaculia bacterium]